MGRSVMDDHKALTAFLESCRYMTIAVISEGEPWAVPVHIQRRDGFTTFEWDSHQDTVHSVAITKHPRVSLSMYRPGGELQQFGFYAIAEVEKVVDLPGGHARYKATVKQAWVNDETFVKRQIEL